MGGSVFTLHQFFGGGGGSPCVVIMDPIGSKVFSIRGFERSNNNEKVLIR